jgi:hypothetical protein
VTPRSSASQEKATVILRQNLIGDGSPLIAHPEPSLFSAYETSCHQMESCDQRTLLPELWTNV